MEQSALMPNILMIAMIVMVFYFLLIRPQKKKMEQHKAMLAAINRGDKILTGGGIIGKVVKVNDGDDELSVEIAPEVRVKVARSTVTGVLSKPEPAAKEAAAASGGSEEPKGLMGKLFPRK